MRDRYERGSAVKETEGVRAASAAKGDGAERKLVFLRTVYPLNPGIPHYLDFPQPRD
jgi:hypothetical protein